MVESKLDDWRGLAARSVATSCLCSCLLLKASLLVRLCLRLVLRKQLKQRQSLSLVEGLTELIDCWWHLKALVQDPLLPLQADICRPLNEAGEVALSWLQYRNSQRGLSEVSGCELRPQIITQRQSE